MENSSSIQSGIAPPQGLAVEGLRSKRKVSMPPAASASAAEDPAGPPPTTAARSLLEMMNVEGFSLGLKSGDLHRVFSGIDKEWSG